MNIRLLTEYALLLFASVVATPSAFAQDWWNIAVKHEDLAKWLESDTGKKYSQARHKMEIAELQKEISKAGPIDSSKEAKAEFKKKIDEMKAELAAMKKNKQPKYAPVIRVGPNLTKMQGCVGELAYNQFKGYIKVFQVAGDESAIISYPDGDITFSASSGFGNSPKTSFVWLEGYPTADLPIGEQTLLKKGSHFIVDGYQDYTNTLGASVRLPKIRLIDLSKELDKD